MSIRVVFLAIVTISCAQAAEPVSFVGMVINTTSPEKPVAAPIQFFFGQDGSCTLTISPPLIGSGPCILKSYEQKSGRLELTSSGAANITWTGTVKGNFASGSYRVEPGAQVGNFYLAVIRQDDPGPKPKPQPQALPRVVPRLDAGCAPAIESSISGEFHGWDGETIFKLDNGQIWQQAEYDYTYSYSYRPDVTIYQTRAGCRMKVEDEDDTIMVERIK